VIKGVASDLFPGESSGYNSSASSLNGDAHGSNAPSESSATPSPADIIVHDHEQPNKRLSMVTEENQALHEESSSPDPGFAQIPLILSFTVFISFFIHWNTKPKDMFFMLQVPQEKKFGLGQKHGVG